MLVALLGREREFAAARSQIARMPTGGVTVILEGPAGIGKSALFEASVGDVQRRGWRVEMSRPGQAESSLSFVVLGDLLGSLFDELGGHLSTGQRRAVGGALLRTDGGADRRAVGLAVLEILRLAASVCPIVLAIDDLQWVDTPSALAVSFALRRLRNEPVGVIASLRRSEDSGDPIDLVSAMSDVARVPVGPLDARSLRRILTARLGVTPAVGEVRRLAALTGGNPLYAVELARSLAGRSVPLPGEPAAVPTELAGVLRSRLAALPSEVRDVLTVCATSPRPTLAVVLAAAGDGADEAVVVAESAGIVELDTERIVFTHPLFGSTIVAMAVPERLREIHRRLAALTSDPEERARHLAFAAEGPDEVAATKLDEAADVALMRGAPETAAELAELALRLSPPVHAASLRERRVALSSFRFQSGDVAEATALLERVVSDSPPGPERAERLLLLAQYGWNDIHRIRRLLREALDQVDDAADPALLSALHAESAFAWVFGGDLAQASAQGARATELAERTNDPKVKVLAILPVAYARFLAGQDSLDAIRQAVALEGGLKGLELGSAPRAVFGAFLMWSGDLDAARVELEREHRDMLARGQPSLLWEVLVYLAELEVRSGDWERASAYAAEGLELIDELGLGEAREVHLWSNALVAANRGEIDRARTLATEGLVLAETHGDVFHQLSNASTLGFLALSLGESAEARDRLSPLEDLAETMGLAEPGVFPFRADLVEARVALGELDDAESSLAVLARQAVERNRPLALALAERCHALVLAGRGDVDGALAHVELSLDHHERTSHPFDRARTLLVHGSLLRRKKQKAAARRVLEEALGIFDGLGARLWADRARAEAARVGGRSSSTALTETERQVAELAAYGRSNAEIAAELFISVHTVSANLKRVYAKLGIRSRTELASRLIAGPRSEAPATGRVLATVLFTDIVGSTERAASLGDDVWRSLLQAHDLRARTQFARFDGREVTSTGDGFLSVFDRPGQAVRCASAINEALEAIGLTVRAGCHTGELDLVPGNVRGIAVHIGARVASLAGPGEVLVTSTVRELVTGSGLDFVDSGEHRLKGVAEPWRLYRLVQPSG